MLALDLAAGTTVRDARGHVHALEDVWTITDEGDDLPSVVACAVADRSTPLYFDAFTEVEVVDRG